MAGNRDSEMMKLRREVPPNSALIIFSNGMKDIGFVTWIA